jgi:uncharacterized glyoxalase superfamily protein PhnB
MLPITMAPRRPTKRTRSAVKSKSARRARAAKRVTPEPVPARRGHTGSGLAPGMQAVNTYLAVANVAASMEFLERAFGFARGVVLAGADGQVRYAEMRHEDSVVMLVTKSDTTSPTGGTAAVYTYVGDVDDALAQARKAGAGVDEAEDKPWGDRVGVVTDPDGYRWVLATFKKLAPFT